MFIDPHTKGLLVETQAIRKLSLINGHFVKTRGLLFRVYFVELTHDIYDSVLFDSVEELIRTPEPR